MSDNKGQKGLTTSWEKSAEDNFEEIDALLDTKEHEADHFKSGLPPSPQDQKDNRERQREFYQKHKIDEQRRKRDEYRAKPVAKRASLDQLLALGMHPRIAIALNRMLAAKPDWMTDEPVSISKVASVMGNFRSTLCNDMAKVSGVLPVNKGNSGCFVEGSQVKTATGLVGIQDLEPGSQVIGFDEVAGVPKTLTIAKTASFRCFEWNQVHTASTAFDVTDKHPILTRTGWVEAGNLRAGDLLMTWGDEGSKTEEVISVTKVCDEAMVHLLEIEEDPHNYIISGVVAHNAKISDDEDEDEDRGEDRGEDEREGRANAVKAADMSEETAKEASIRQDEWQLAQDTTKMGYAVAKALGANEAQAMAAGMYAFTQIPNFTEVDQGILSAAYWRS